MFVHALMSSEDFHITDYAPPKGHRLSPSEGYMGLCRVLRLFPGGSNGRNCDLGYYEWFYSPLTTKSLMSLGPSTRRSGWVQNVFGDNIWYQLRHLKPHHDNDIACLDAGVHYIETMWRNANEVDIIEISDDEVDIIEISSDDEEGNYE